MLIHVLVGLMLLARAYQLDAVLALVSERSARRRHVSRSLLVSLKSVVYRTMAREVDIYNDGSIIQVYYESS